MAMVKLSSRMTKRCLLGMNDPYDDNPPRVPDPGQFTLKENETIEERYFEEVYELGNYSQSSKDQFWQAWDHFIEFLDENKYTIDDVNSDREAREFCKHLNDHDNIESIASKRYAKLVANLFDFYNSRGYFGVDPFNQVVENYNFTASQSSSSPFESKIRDVALTDLRQAIAPIESPLTLTIVILLLKTGIRASEACNIDMRDFTLDHPASDGLLKNESPRTEIADSTDVLYIDQNRREGVEHRGEVRSGGNKRLKPTLIPIDNELKMTLIYWMSVCPPTTSPAKPLLRSFNNGPVGQRMTRSGVFEYVKGWADQNGWRVELDEHHTKDDRNVNPHWCRHYFTNHMRSEVTREDLNYDIDVRSYVKALRGDVGDDVIDTYTHIDEPWFREAYHENIYKILSD